MHEILDLAANPLVWKLLISYWLFSAFVSALPSPASNGNMFYLFFFRFMHGVAGNVVRAAIKFNVPGASADDAAPPAKP